MVYLYLRYSKKSFTIKCIHLTIKINNRLKRTDMKCVNDPFISYLQFSVCMLEGGCLTEEFQNVNYIFSECFFSFICFPLWLLGEAWLCLRAQSVQLWGSDTYL